MDVTSAAERWDDLVPAPLSQSGRSALAAIPPLPGDASTTGRDWRRAYVRRLIVGDLLCSLVAVGVGLVVSFGIGASSETVQVAALWVACCLPLIWPLSMLLAGTYDQRFLWVGADEFCRVFWAATMLLAAVGTISWALKLEVARGFVVVTLPLVMVLTVLSRFAHRRWLRLRRSQGRFPMNIVLVGEAEGLHSLQRRIERMAYLGYRVLGCCVLDDGDRRAVLAAGSLPVLGDISETASVVRRYGADAVVALPAGNLSGDQLRRLGWALEDTDADLMLVPAVTEIVAPRVRLRPQFGLASLLVERSNAAGAPRLVKAALDRTIAVLAVLLLSWAFIGIALCIKATSRGPVFFGHERIGKDGRPFRMLKFRSMYTGAHEEFDALQDLSDGNAVQFKMRRDPRVTPIGRFLRRFSVDELPQLFNVAGGSMSLVGPRPHVTREVEQYDEDMRRRLVVKPGMTGLWQVSGRSDLSWEDSVRVDVRYVENWSLPLDLMIIAKTVRAVLKGSGAY